MSTRPAGLGDRWNRSLSDMSTRNMRMDPTEADQDAARGAEQARVTLAAASERVHHPAIPAPEHKCYRVLRRWKGDEFSECIGFRRTEAEALILLNKELGWAIVVDANGKRVAHNFQPMTERAR